MRYVVGDINGDNKIDIIDFLLIKGYLYDSLELTDEQLKRADANQDGQVNALDFAYIKRHLWGIYPLTEVIEE